MIENCGNFASFHKTECSYYFRFVGGGQSGFGPFLNSGVHMVMYLYYFLAACGPSLQKYLWWKRWGTAAPDDNDDCDENDTY